MFDKGVSSNTESVLVGVVFTAIIFFLLGFNGGCESETAPMDKANKECEEAWVDANDGDSEEVPAIYNEPWCQQHNAAKRQTQVIEQQEEVQEATTP